MSTTSNYSIELFSTNENPVWKYWVSRQVSLKGCENVFIKRHTNCTAKMRSILFDWLYDVVDNFRLCNDTYFATVHLFDRYLASDKVNAIMRSRLQAVGVTCLWLCAILHETCPPKKYRLVRVTADSVSDEQLSEIAQDIFRCLDGDIYVVPNIFTFLRARSDAQITTHFLGENKIVQCALYECARCAALCFLTCTRFYQSTIAQACCFIVNELGANEQNKNTTEIEEEIMQCVTQILKMMQSIIDQVVKCGVFEKTRVFWRQILQNAKNDQRLQSICLKKEEKDREKEQGREKEIVIKKENSFCRLYCADSCGKKYSINSILGKGSYGIVYRAEQKGNSEIEVAIKKPLANTFECDFSLRELTVLRALNHRNIIKLKEFYVSLEVKRGLSFVMNCVDGGDLFHFIQKNRGTQISLATTQHIIREIVAAVKYLHENCIAHRDLKSGNILFDEGGQKITLIDFGMARVLYPTNEKSSPFVYSPQTCSLPYIAPEIILGDEFYDPMKLDLWSLACIIAEIGLGKLAFTENHTFSITRDEQLQNICRFLGSPKEEAWPKGSQLPNWPQVDETILFRDENRWKRLEKSLTSCGVDLLQQMFEYDPLKRLNIEEIQNHLFLQQSLERLESSNVMNLNENDQYSSCCTTPCCTTPCYNTPCCRTT